MKNFLLNGFEDFITGSGIWILVGCLAFALLVSVVFLILNIRKDQQTKEAKTEAKTEEKPVEEKKEEKVEKKEEVKEEPKKETKTEAKKTEPKKETKAEPKKETKKAEPKKAAKEEPAEEGGDYEVSYDEENKQWIVKRTTSERATKRTKTKQEAVDYAKPLAEKNNVKLIVHNKNEK